MKITVKVSTDLVRQGLEDLESETPKVGRRRMRTVMERIKRRMQEYPPERPGQSIEEPHPVLGKIFKPAKGRYKRTGTLGGKWAILKWETGYTITNDATQKGRAYGQYVVGSAYGTGQAWMHVGRWQLFRDVVDEETAKLPEEVQDELQTVTRRYQ